MRSGFSSPPGACLNRALTVLVPQLSQSMIDKCLAGLWPGGALCVRSETHMKPFECPRFVLLGNMYVRGALPYACSAEDPWLAAAGVAKRILTERAGVLGAGATTEARDFTRQLITLGLHRLEDREIMDVREWLREQYPTERAKTILAAKPDWDLETAARMLADEMASSEPHVPLADVEAFVTVKGFPKGEVYDEPKPPRNIHPRGDAYLRLMGPLIHAAERRIIRDLGDVIGLVKGMTIPERAAYTAQRLGAVGPYVTADYSAFEGSIRDIASVIEQQVFYYLIRDLSQSEEYRQLLQLNTSMVRVDRKLVWYYVRCRMSGDLWTSIGNALTNFVVTVLAWTRAARRGGLKITPLQMARIIRGVFEGDDSLLHVPSGYPQPTPEDFAHYGMVSKMAYADTLAEALFCQTCWSEDGNLLNIVRTLCRFFTSNAREKFDDRAVAGLLRAKATSLAYLSPHCPIVWALAKRTLRETRGVECIWTPDWWHKRLQKEAQTAHIDPSPPSAQTRAYVALSRGISEVEQVACEHYILDIWEWGTPLDGPVALLCSGYGGGQSWTWPAGTPVSWVCRPLRQVPGKCPKTLALHKVMRGGTTVLWSSSAQSCKAWMKERGAVGWSFGSGCAALHMA